MRPIPFSEDAVRSIHSAWTACSDGSPLLLTGVVSKEVGHRDSGSIRTSSLEIGFVDSRRVDVV